jgi:hypothetical protein
MNMALTKFCAAPEKKIDALLIGDESSVFR